MRIKRLLALVLSAAMALTLFAGCCSPSLLQLLLDLLQEQYQNITVTAEDDLDAALREAVSEYDTLEEMDAALAQTLGKTVEFESLRSARAGDKAFDLVYRAGTDTEAMARLTYTEWNKILGSLPASGQYLADLAVRKADGGYYILVDIAVTRGGSSGGNHNSSDDEENNPTQPENPPAPQPQPDYEPVYNENNVLTGYKIHTHEGLQKVFFEDMTTDDLELMSARNGTSGWPTGAGFVGLTITLDSGVKYEVKETFGLSPDGEFKLPFQGTLTSSDLNDPATINLSGCAMFAWVGSAGGYSGISEVSNVNFHVTKTIQGVSAIPNTMSALYAGAVAYICDSSIKNCYVTFAENCGIDAQSDRAITGAYVGGIVGTYLTNPNSSVTGCKVTGGKITVNELPLVDGMNGQVESQIYVGGIVGYGLNVSGCTAATAIDVDSSAKKCYVGGIAGRCGGAASDNIYDSNVVTLNGNEPTRFVGNQPDDVKNGQYVGKEIGYQS